MKGTLYVVSTPIGNLSDITLRALDVLKSVDVIYAEDTRETIKLLNHYGISTPLKTYLGGYQKKRHDVLDHLLNGRDVALVADRGTPCINDPGYEIVAEAYEADVQVVPVPGANAAAAALSASGFEADRYYYAGFIAKRGELRTKQLVRVALEPDTVVFYESPARLVKTLKQIVELSSPGRPAVVFKELTKANEKAIRGSLEEVLQKLSDVSLKGEFVVVLGPFESRSHEDIDKLIEQLEQMSLKPGDIAGLVSRLTGTDRKTVYKKLLERKKT